MHTVTVRMLQNWFDISIQYTGNALNAFLIATANNRSISSNLVPGESILIPDELTKSSKALQYFEAREIVPATGLNGLEQFRDDGIGVMIIEDTFIIR